MLYVPKYVQLQNYLVEYLTKWQMYFRYLMYQYEDTRHLFYCDVTCKMSIFSPQDWISLKNNNLKIEDLLMIFNFWLTVIKLTSNTVNPYLWSSFLRFNTGLSFPLRLVQPRLNVLIWDGFTFLTRRNILSSRFFVKIKWVILG